MNRVLAITKKELKAYFGSPMAALFIGAFLVSALFSFFWLETFFARNTADIRPLFRWMPILMIFLVGALTMRQWSEEQRMGTLEILLTLPVKLWQLVIGKFLAVLVLVTVALALTLGLPITVSLLGNMDWGPVFGGYLGALLMAAAYISIGLFISSRTDNQIVALILTVLVGGFFYLLGSSGITNFMGNAAGEFFRSLGTGSRFASIERGVVDIRDLAYYGSLALFFLMLNVVSLDRKRWSRGINTLKYRRTIMIGSVLIAANLLAGNIWLNKVSNLRLDLTENNEYSLSQVSKDMIDNLQEPLLLRGYFSEKTHPLLSPLIPRVKDLMEEYAIASDGHVEVSFVDPKFDEALEAEANQQFGIKPVPFQVAGRYESSVVNSYFNILIKYGDQHITLGFNDIIEIQPRPDGQIDVRLRNLEYDLTKSIKKVVYGFQSLSTVFAKIQSPVALTAIISKDSLPEPLAELPGNISKAAEALAKDSDNKLRFELIDPGQDPQRRAAVNEKFGIAPMPVSLFSQESIYLFLFLSVGDTHERIYLTEGMGEAEIRKEVEAVLKRTSSGFVKTIGLWVPTQDVPPQLAMMGQTPPEAYRAIQQVLPENYNLEKVAFGQGRVPANIDVLLVVAPQDLSDLERFAIDQYLMRGGAVVALAGSYVLDLDPNAQALRVKPVENGMADLLNQYGFKVAEALVMDKQNEPFPVPVTRDLGGFQVQEIKQIDYPFFVDVRQDGMAKESPAVASLPAVTMNWVSPIVVDKEKNSKRQVFQLLSSSSQSWLYTGPDVQPDFGRYPENGFAPGEDFASQVLAVSAQGVFDSYFADRPDPRAEQQPLAQVDEEELTDGESMAADKDATELPQAPIIKKSSESARLVVVGSSEFVNDTVISISQSMSQDRFLNSLGFLQNLIDWSVEDEELLLIRSRGIHARLLLPLSRQEQTFWEWLNYAVAIVALLIVSLYGGLRRKKERPMVLSPSGGPQNA
jgi:ABC-2 type transport system permease protein